MFNFFPGEEIARTFSQKYRCFSVSMWSGQDRPDVEKGGKIIMPTSALDQLTRLNIQYPMLFRLTNTAVTRATHCGVLEFVADEGHVYLPYWMMKNLLLDEGSLVNVENVSLPVATFAKFQPQSVDFLDITNPKAVLENDLRSFACLTTGDIFAITYIKKEYEFCVLETRPGDAVCIIECDMNVEFAPPVGYVEPQRQQSAEQEDAAPEEGTDDIDSCFRPFSGEGRRVDGKERRSAEASDGPGEQANRVRGIPDYEYKRGTLVFLRSSRLAEDQAASTDDDFSPFRGGGQTLRESKQRK